MENLVEIDPRSKESLMLILKVLIASTDFNEEGIHFEQETYDRLVTSANQLFAYFRPSLPSDLFIPEAGESDEFYLLREEAYRVLDETGKPWSDALYGLMLECEAVERTLARGRVDEIAVMLDRISNGFHDLLSFAIAASRGESDVPTSDSVEYLERGFDPDELITSARAQFSKS
jgi:hypothetical protein